MNQKCSIVREMIRTIVGVRMKIKRPTSLLLQAWAVGLGLVFFQFGLIVTIMNLFPPNLLTVPAVFLLMISSICSIAFVVYIYEECQRKCRGW